MRSRNLYVNSYLHLEIRALKGKAFDNVRGQIGFCGIWCGSCVLGNGSLKELTKRYEDIVEKYGLREWAPEGFDYDKFRKELTSVKEVSLCDGCLKGGGRTDCEMRDCASNKRIADCCRCDEFMACKNSEPLQKMREGARNADLLVKDENVERQEFIEKGTSELRKKFPSCILLCDKH
jgi:hypothetical protein